MTEKSDLAGFFWYWGGVENERKSGLNTHIQNKTSKHETWIVSCCTLYS